MGNQEEPKIVIKEKRVASIRRKHPWIFSGAIHGKIGSVKDGDRVTIVDPKDQFLGVGHYQEGSISIRLISFAPIKAFDQFWVDRIANALQYRQRLGIYDPKHNNCFRLVHGEGDGLPGLVIDVYGDTAVVQCHSIGMYFEKDHITRALIKNFPDTLKAIYCKSSNTLPNNFAANKPDEYWWGQPSTNYVLENGVKFSINWETGQKTGFFLDQRENRQLLISYVNGKTVLNAFCYTGGFSIYALKAGARSVHSVDISGTALEQLEENITINQMESKDHQAFKADVLSYFKTCDAYDVVICDPPAFAKHLKKRHNAIQGYKRLNVAAIQCVKSGGLLATFSCSQVVDDQLFYNTITAAAYEANRSVRVIKKLSQAPDHPINIFHPEGSYLKGLLLYVE